MPELPARCVERILEPIQPAGSLGPRRDPSLVAEHLQMAADGRLGELEHGLELVDRQLVLLEEEYNATSHRVCQCGHAVE